MRRVLFALLALFGFGTALTAAEPGSDWHPDADGDSVDAGTDVCAWVYDPAQTDTDNDGIGDACDADFAPPAPGGAISDLRIEHVTPYGAWLSFTSPHDTTYGWTVALAWSSDAAELTTLTGFQAAFERGDFIQSLVMARHGEALRRPLILTRLAPGSTYYVAATELAWDGLVDRISPVLPFQTPAASLPVLPTTRPRVFTTPAHIAQLQALRLAGDSGWVAWESLTRTRTQQAASDPENVYIPHQYCASAALLYRVAGQAADLADAGILLDLNIRHWEDNELQANHYRWADSQLAICLDLLWPDLDAATRNRAVAALLADDEAQVVQGLPRLDDTDEFASTTRTWLVNGLTVCDAGGIDPALATRGCAVLDAGLRLWHGVQLVKARRDRGFWAQSGGFLPDGTDYGQGTARYWLQAFLALANSAALDGNWAPFVRNLLTSIVLQPLSPSRLGFLTAGDVEDFSYNFGIEDNSFQLEQADAGLLTLAAGTLDRLGDSQSAAWARFLANDIYPVAPSEDAFYHLLFGASALPATDHRTALPTAHFDSGNGIFFDRSSWSGPASMLFQRGGWNGVDHSHGDVGHFQLYRRGRWITHEAIGYDGPAATGQGHNVLLLSTPRDGNPDLPGQDRFATSLSRMRRASSGSEHAAVVLDSTSAYLPDTETQRYFDAVQRSLFWLKTDTTGRPDVLLLLDRVQRTATAPTTVGSRWQMHFDAAPSLAGNSASLTLPASPLAQQVRTTILLPTDASLSVLAPEGLPDTYPAQIYTHRLLVDAAAGRADDTFLVVLQAADVGSSLPAAQHVSAGALSGALIGTDLVLLPGTALRSDHDGLAGFSVTVDTTAALRVFVAGLLPHATLDVVAGQTGASLQLNASAGTALHADGAGVLAFTVDANRIISPVYDGPPLFADGFEGGPPAAVQHRSAAVAPVDPITAQGDPDP